MTFKCNKCYKKIHNYNVVDMRTTRRVIVIEVRRPLTDEWWGEIFININKKKKNYTPLQDESETERERGQ